MLVPNQIVSLWDMLEKDAGRILELVNFVTATAHLFSSIEASKRIGGFHKPDFESLIISLRELREVAIDLDLPMSAALAERLVGIFDNALARDHEQQKVMLDVSEFIRAHSTLQQLQAMKDEAGGKLFIGLDPRGAALWRLDRPPFGTAVEQAFPSAREDIEEASKCLAVDRGTACVMHLMRASEIPLKALAAHLGIGRQNDWGSYIREISKELDARLKSAGKHTLDEEFYAEAAHSFDRLKRAWRNRTMHTDRSYTPERAREIFDATRDFMAYLSQQVQE